jgi:hypothetical protein
MNFFYLLPPGDVAYDIETYPNVFTLTAIHITTGDCWQFEVSPRRNDSMDIIRFIYALADAQCRMIGFNSVGFDYPVLHYLVSSGGVLTAEQLYNKAMSIIRAPDEAKFSHIIWESDWIVPQIDLFKIHHFDNRARATSLKVLEFNMRMANIEDLPFDVGTMLYGEQIDMLLKYNKHDVQATIDFYHKSTEQIRFREQLTQQYGKWFMNHNDTKIGKDYFIMELEKVHPQCCYKRVDGKRVMQQTIRDQIRIADVILPYVQFQHPEFQRILTWFRQQVITETKGSIKDINCTINGFRYDFGTGGIHGSVESQVVESDEQWIILDFDVASMYPNIAIANNLSPAHLGETFCAVYKDLYEQRKQYAKGTPENAMLKLALNGVYGDSNNQYSPFFDPQYTMSITINGQLLLCMLAEAMLQSSELSVIQSNTDGLTIRCPRRLKDWTFSVCRWWEQLTGLQLEHVEYKRMMIRDCNNYIAEGVDGKLKRKGAYEYKMGWHQDHSALVVPKAAEAALVHGKDIREFIMSHEDIMDFMLRAKVPRSSTLEWGRKRVANIVRYYVSTDGDILEKVMPAAGPDGEYKRANGLTDDWYEAVMAEIGPGVWDARVHTKNKSKYEERRMGINTGWTVWLCNDLEGITTFDINYEFYIAEAMKLVVPVRGW